MQFNWRGFPKPVPVQPQPVHISPDTALIIQALARGQRSQIQPMPPPRQVQKRQRA